MRFRSFFAGAALLLAAGSFAQDLTAEQKKSVLDEVERVVTTRAFVPGFDFSQWKTKLAEHQTKIDEAKDVAAFTRVMNESLRGMGLSHLRLMTPRQASMRGRTNLVGIGAMVTKEEGGLRIRTVSNESPAKLAGLAAGELITKVDGNLPTAETAIEGEIGKKITLEIKNAKDETREVTIEIQRFSIVRKDSLTWNGDDAAVLKVHSFSAGYDREAIEKFMGEAAKAKYLVLDLRGNGGGAVNNLNHLLSLLMPEKTPYGVFVGRRMTDEYVKANEGKPLTPEAIAAWAPTKVSTRLNPKVAPFTGRIAVLINRGSASASEITALSLQEGVSAKIIGTRTAGAVLASVYARLPEGFSLQYPISDFVSTKGRRLEKNPLLPDVEVTATPNAEGDAVLEKALETLRATK